MRFYSRTFCCFLVLNTHAPAHSSDVLSLSTLCIHPAKSAWVLYVDAICINYDGNAFDAALVAMVAALKNSPYHDDSLPLVFI